MRLETVLVLVLFRDSLYYYYYHGLQFMYQIVTPIQTFPLPLVSCCATWTWMKCIKDSGPCWPRSALWLCHTQRLIDGCFFRHLTSVLRKHGRIWKGALEILSSNLRELRSACTTKYWVLLMPCVILSCVYYSFQSLRLRQRNIWKARLRDQHTSRRAKFRRFWPLKNQVTC